MSIKRTSQVVQWLRVHGRSRGHGVDPWSRRFHVPWSSSACLPRPLSPQALDFATRGVPQSEAVHRNDRRPPLAAPRESSHGAAVLTQKRRKKKKGSETPKQEAAFRAAGAGLASASPGPRAQTPQECAGRREELEISNKHQRKCSWGSGSYTGVEASSQPAFCSSNPPPPPTLTPGGQGPNGKIEGLPTG